MSWSTRSRLRRNTAVAIAAVLAVSAASCGSSGGDSSGGESTASQPSTTEASAAADVDADKILAIVSDKVTELGLTGAVVGVWRGDEKVIADAVGESPVGAGARHRRTVVRRRVRQDDGAVDGRPGPADDG